MNRETYQSLIDCQFLRRDGCLIRYWSPSDHQKYFTFREVSDKLYGQMSEEIDYNNIIISFPVASHSDTGFFGPGNNPGDPRQVLIDHITYKFDVFEALDKNGVRFKNGIKLTDNKYAQKVFTLLVVHDGVAYVNDNVANPWTSNIGYSQWSSDKEIKLNDEDLKIPGLLDKNIIFAGFFVRRMRDAKIIE